MPQKRILPYIILGILNNQKQLNGKAISNEFKNDIGEFWQSSHSQIYPELKRMEKDKWIKIISQVNNDKEIYYAITMKGKHILDEWLATTDDYLPASHDIFSLKLFFIHDKNDSRLQSLIANQRKLVNAQLTHLQQRKIKLFATTQQIDANYGHYLILQRAIVRQKRQLKWLNDLLNKKR